MLSTKQSYFKNSILHKNVHKSVINALFNIAKSRENICKRWDDKINYGMYIYVCMFV